MTTYTCTRGSVLPALREIFKCSHAYVCVVNHAHPTTFNINKRLWGPNDVLPPTPFGIGVWYKNTHRLMPIGIVKNVQSSMTVGEFRNNLKSPPIIMAVLMQYVLERMSAMYSETKPSNTQHDKIARCAMWLACAPELREGLATMDETYDLKFRLNYVTFQLNSTILRELLELRPWITGWVKGQMPL